ncbi:hypothetical protein IID22_03865 [Patescibacteria group bacterium]|nr:hypothetical protein [Patescibacteria group bacterium]
MEIVKTKAPFTQSQRLRHVLFKAWEQTKRTETAEEHYQRNMERFINKVKENLE